MQPPASVSIESLIAAATRALNPEKGEQSCRESNPAHTTGRCLPVTEYPTTFILKPIRRTTTGE